MKRNSIADLLGGKVEIGTRVMVSGWVRTRRDSKAALSFISINDGSCFASIQIVANNDLANFETDVRRITTAFSIEVEGELVVSMGKGQTVEIHAAAVKIIGDVDDPKSYPIPAQKRVSFEHLRTIAHLRPRTNTFGAISRVRHCLSMAVHDYFNRNGFLWVHTPLVTANDCEGAGDMFRVSTLDLLNVPLDENGAVDYSKDFFGKETHLTVSGQLNLETHVCALSKVYSFGPTFRAENSNTSRHLSEFWMIEPEIAFTDLAGNADLAEGLLKSIFKDLLDKRMDDLEFFQQRIDKDCITRLEKFVSSSFQRMTYTEAINALINAKESFEFPVTWGCDLQSEHERWLTEKYVQAPVVVMDYPKDIKAFYMRMNDDGKTVAAMDVLAPGIGEIIGGSQREERLDVLDSRIDELKLSKEQYWWYRDLRRYGTVPHCGFGLGFERTIIYATGMTNIRDVIPFPRAPKNADF